MFSIKGKGKQICFECGKRGWVDNDVFWSSSFLSDFSRNSFYEYYLKPSKIFPQNS